MPIEAAFLGETRATRTSRSIGLSIFTDEWLIAFVGRTHMFLEVTHAYDQLVADGAFESIARVLRADMFIELFSPRVWMGLLRTALDIAIEWNVLLCTR